ncbi:diguanylate cyclase domain-containing protein [Oceanithermus sp.]
MYYGFKVRLQRLGPAEWRIHVFSRAVIVVAVGLFARIGAFEINPNVYWFFLTATFLYLALVTTIYTRAGAWLDWVSLVFDVTILSALLHYTGGVKSPLIIFVYLWLFAKLTMNVRRGDPGALPVLAVMGLATPALGAWGEAGWGQFMAVQLLTVALFLLVSHVLLRERRRNQRDPLTQVLHRGAGLEPLAERMRSREPFDLAFIDLKGFKQINDTHDHAVGHEVLRGVAGRLLGFVRSQDLVIRYGGDEFLVVGPPGGLRERIERIFCDPVVTSAGPVPLLGDVGVVTWEPDQGGSLDELLARADAAMYRMKYTGLREDH